MLKFLEHFAASAHMDGGCLDGNRTVMVTCSNCRGNAPRNRMKFREWRTNGEYQYKFICCGHCRTSWGKNRRHPHGKNCFLNKNAYYVANPEYDPTYNPSVRERAVKCEETTTEEEEDKPFFMEDTLDDQGESLYSYARRQPSVKRSRSGSRIPPPKKAGFQE